MSATTSLTRNWRGPHHGILDEILSFALVRPSVTISRKVSARSRAAASVHSACALGHGQTTRHLVSLWCCDRTAFLLSFSTVSPFARFLRCRSSASSRVSRRSLRVSLSLSSSSSFSSCVYVSSPFLTFSLLRGARCTCTFSLTQRKRHNAFREMKSRRETEETPWDIPTNVQYTRASSPEIVVLRVNFARSPYWYYTISVLFI